MKTRSLIIKVLLLTMVLSPSGLRAFASRVSLSSCRVRTLHNATVPSKDRTILAAHRLVLSIPGYRSPAQRIHRIRGHKINVEAELVPTPSFFVVGRLPFSEMAVSHQELDGPNPSRGPPNLLFL